MQTIKNSQGQWKIPDYGPNSKLFSLRVHFGGEFKNTPMKQYVGGCIDITDYCNPDYLSMLVFHQLAKQLCLCDAEFSYYFVRPGLGLEGGLVHIYCDNVVKEMGTYGLTHKLIDFFVVQKRIGENFTGDIDGAKSKEKPGPNIDEAETERDRVPTGEIGSPVRHWTLKYAARKRGKLPVKRKLNNPSTTRRQSSRIKAQNLKAKKSANKGKQKEIEGDGDDEEMNLSDRERWHDSDYEFSDEDDLGTILKEREKDWEEVASHFAVPRNSEAEVENDSDESVAFSDEMEMHCSSESEGTSRKVKFKRFRAETDMDDPVFTVGLIFSSRDEFKVACKHHGVKHGRRIRLEKIDKQRVTAICMDCEWLVSIVPRPKDEGWQVRRTNATHSCGTTWNHGCANSVYLSRKYKEDFWIMPHMRVAEFAAKVHVDMKINISKNKARNAKKLAVKKIEGDYTEQYNKLHDYCKEVCRANPGSNIFIKTTENENGDQVFQRLYYCLEACKRGFLVACWHLVGLDGCHLRGPHKGILLTAVWLDPNDQIFPICVAVVEIENKVTWKWFLRELMQDLKITDSSGWTFITDKQKGLSSAIFELLPESEHRMCVWHMLQNFKKVHNGMALYDTLWAAAKASYVSKFAAEIEKMKNLDDEAYKWVRTHSTPKNWSRSHFRTEPKCDILVNNICECFNKVLLDAREKPILAMLESIRFYLMVRMENKRAKMKNFRRSVCPKIQQKVEVIKAKSNECIATHAGELLYEIRCWNGDQFTVDLKNRACSCRRWELNGIPCVYAVSAVATTREEPEVFIDKCYSRDSYLKAYEPIVFPINGKNLWEQVNWGPLLPPENIRLPGRPKKARRKDPNEVMHVKRKGKDMQKLSRAGQMTYRCGICKETGHNSRKCPNPNKSTEAPQGGSQPEAAQGGPRGSQPEASQEGSQPEASQGGSQPEAAQGDSWGSQPEASQGDRQPSISRKRSSTTAFGEEAGVKRVKPQKCSLCRKEGHNRSKCREAISGLYESGEPHMD